METKLLLALAGGGSGGHLRPLQAVAEALGERAICQHIFPHGRIEDRWPETVEQGCHFLQNGRYHKGFVAARLWRIMKALLEVNALYRRSPWRAVLSTGGHAAFPVCLHAVIRGLPLFLMEPNQTAGKVNRWFASRASQVFVHYASTEGFQREVVQTGTPLVLRENPEFESGQQRYFLAFGASLGARKINEFMAEWIEQFRAPVVWITGEADFAGYRKFHHPPNVYVLPFVQNMAWLYARTDLALCRPGASTVAELEYFRVPSICIPYPSHRDRQQEKNCEHLREAGASMVIPDTELPHRASEILELASNTARLQKMRGAFPYRATANSAVRIGELILQDLLT